MGYNSNGKISPFIDIIEDESSDNDYGLLPFSKMQQKFRPQSIDSVNGNNLYFFTFGKNTKRRLKEFK